MTAVSEHSGTCPVCTADLDGLRSDARYCGAACRRKAARRRQAASEPGRQVPAPGNGSGPQRRADRVAQVQAPGQVQPRVAEVRARGQVQPPQLDLTERIAAAIEGTDPDSGLTHRELAQVAYSVEDPTAAQLSAVRRSVARLIADGRAGRGRRRRVSGRWGRGGTPVEIHRPLTTAERVAEADRIEERRRLLTERKEAKELATPYAVDTGIGGFFGLGGTAVEEVQVAPVLKITEEGVELREPQEVGS